MKTKLWRKTMSFLPLLLFSGSIWGYEVGEVFTSNIGTEEEPFYMKFQRISGSQAIGPTTVAYCSVYGEYGDPAIDADSYGQYGDGSLYIPGTVEGMLVTEISDYAFAGCYNIEEVHIYSNSSYWDSSASYSTWSIRHIGERAFQDCSSLRTFIWKPFSKNPDWDPWSYRWTYHNMGSGVFENCSMLSEVSLPDEATNHLPDYTFYNCESLAGELTVGSLGEYALYGTQITSLKFNSEDVVISEYSLPSTLESIHLGKNVENFSFYDIYRDDIYNFQSITVDPDNTTFSSPEGSNALIRKNDNYDGYGNTYYDYGLVLGCNGTIIPENVTTIYDEAFPFYVGYISIPKNVENIGRFAFRYAGTIYFEGVPEYLNDEWFDGLNPDPNIYVPVQGYNYFQKKSRFQNYMDHIHPFLQMDSEWISMYIESGCSDWTVPEGIEVYIPTEYSDGEVTLTQVPYILDGRGILLHTTNPLYFYSYSLEKLPFSRYSKDWTQFWSQYGPVYTQNMLTGKSLPQWGYYDKTIYPSEGSYQNYRFNVDHFRAVEEGGEELNDFEAYLRVDTLEYSDRTEDIYIYTGGKKGTVTVTVKDKNGVIANANVTLTSKNSLKETTGVTNKDGICIIKDLQDGDYTITVTAKDHKSGKGEVTIKNGSNENVEIILEIYGTLNVHVRDTSGAGVKATVRIVDKATGQNVLNQQTNGEGDLTQTLPAGEYTIKASATGYSPAEKDITVEAGEKYEETLVLTRGSVTVTVKDKNGVIANANVTLTHKTSSNKVTGKTDNNGICYIQDLAEGDYTITVTAKYHKDGKGEVTIKDGSNENVEIMLEIYGTVTVTVKDKNGVIANANVALTHKTSSNKVTGKTDNNGICYIQDLAEGDYTITVTAKDHKDGKGEVTIKNGSNENVEIMLEAYATLNVHVRDKKDSGVEATIKIVDKATGQNVLNQQTNGEGDLTQTLPAGKYTIKASATDYEPTEKDITIEEGEKYEETLVLSKFVEVIIDVMDEYTLYTEEAPHVAGASITIRNIETGKEEHGISGKDGRYSFKLLEGKYLITVEADNHATRTEEITVKDDMTKIIPMEISFTGGMELAYEVEETEYDDHYNLSISTTYNTTIPKPVVTLSLPSTIDLAPGESVEVKATVTNKGLLRAEDVHLIFPSDLPYCDIEILTDTENLTLEGKESKTIVLRFTMTGQSDCKPKTFRVGYSWPLGTGRGYDTTPQITKIGSCPQSLDDIRGFIMGGGIGSGSGQGTSGGTAPNSDGNVNFNRNDRKSGQEEPETEKKPEKVDINLDIKIDHELIVARQAFRGTLKLTNPTPTDYKNFKIEVLVTDKEKQRVSDDKFAVKIEKYEGFEGNENEILSAGSTGTITILFVPTTEAAPTDTVPYWSQAVITYTDAIKGNLERVSIPKRMPVTPTPILNLDYFVQSNLIGDDPFTEDVVEESIGADFVLLISNIGYGEAKKVRLSTGQPIIIDNKGLKIDFELEGNDFVDFGNIAPNSTVFERWKLKSSIMGHLSDFNVEYSQEDDGFDNTTNFSLINQVKIHELIKLITDNDEIIGLLANENTNATNTNDVKKRNARLNKPNSLYLTSDGKREDIHLVDASIEQNGEDKFIIRLTAPKDEWYYAQLPLPAEKISLLDSEGEDYNVWQTDITFDDDFTWTYESFVHVAGKSSSDSETVIEVKFKILDTHISDVNTDGPTGEGWFTLSGQKISQPKKKGVYIHNGEKIIIR